MYTDLTLSLEDHPGALAEAAGALGRANVNIDGFCGQTVAGRGVIHLLVDDGEGAKTALEGAGIEIRSAAEVLVVAVEDRPGVLASVARGLADAGVNIHTAYLATGTRLVLGVDDLEKGRQATGEAA